MKKLISLLTVIGLLVSIIPQVTIFADNNQDYKEKYPDYYDAMEEAVRCVYIYTRTVRTTGGDITDIMG